MAHRTGQRRLRIGIGIAMMALLVLLPMLAAPASASTAHSVPGIWSWGTNHNGQLGNGTTNDSLVPIAGTGLSGVVAVDTGGGHSVALRADGSVWTWGYNRNGELGYTTTGLCSFDASPCSLVPLQVPGVSGVALSTGTAHTLLRAADGSLWAWGFNGYGQLGMTTSTTCEPGYRCSRTPLQIQGLPATTAFVGGHLHSLALAADGTVWSWGGNMYGQLGRSSANPGTCQYSLACDPTPAQVPGLTNIVAVYAGSVSYADHSFALQRDGTVWAWGLNDRGQLGVATTDVCTVYSVAYSCSTRPVRVPALSGVRQLSVGTYHSLALTNAGTVLAWGYNNRGQLGDGTLTSRMTPMPVSGLSDIVEVTAGDYFSIARRRDGTLWGWGANERGQLGVGNTANQLVPVENSGLTGATTIATGDQYVLALSAESVGINTSSPTICVGEPTTINVDFTNISDLYGYELKVNYPAAGFTAAGAFVNSWFDATDASVPAGWDGSASGGVVRFAASRQSPASPISGGGTVAQVTLTATSAGNYDITISDVLLSDRDANPIETTISPSTVRVEVCGYTTLSGRVNLQGRGRPPTGTIPPTSGTVTLADAGFGPYSATFDASGNFVINHVKVAPGGTDYTVSAGHGVYLSNQRVVTLAPGATLALPDTRLKGGDANNSGRIDLGDLTCIGGSFGSAGAVCGTNGSSDINADGRVNILDLVLPAGNYSLTSPQGW